jgi:hypothetical protein
LIYVCRKISFVKNDPKFVESRNFKNYIQRDFNQDLYHALFNLNWEINDPNVLREKFQIAFNYVADIHAPLQSRKVRNRKAPWPTMGPRLFIYYLIQKSLIILMICETIQKKWIVY